ncbi:MAG: hypothetical protein ACREVI_04275 [Steroidobacteraceae bacterium]
MLPERLLALGMAAMLSAGCSTADRRSDIAPPPLADDGQVVTGYLTTLEQLGRAGPAEQAEILQSARSGYLSAPSTQRRLRYAFVLAVPGHAASDPAGARALLGEVLATPETMLPSERALAELMVRDLDARLALTRENEVLRNGVNLVDRDRIAELNRRLQAESAEKERLRRELEQAKAKLEAIATLEGGKAEPRP